MAWRISNAVIRGSIDNRVEGRVTGEIHLLNRPEPLRLNLKGNCRPDLAGSLLRFENPRPDEGDNTMLHPDQTGTAGDLTASRKVRVLDIPVEEAYLACRSGKEVPEHLANSLYLEWFSARNGRVLIEAVDFRTEISDRCWEMDASLEKAQESSAAQAMKEFFARAEPFRDGGADQSMNEFQWEKLLKESDARTDKYGALLEKYQHHPDCERMVAREMGWDHIEDLLDADEKGLFEGMEGSHEDLAEPEPDPLTEGVDWIRGRDGRPVHPLHQRAYNVAMDMSRDCKAAGLLGEDGDEDLQRMVSEAQTLSIKLAGALNDICYREGCDYGFVVATLKRALEFLNRSLQAGDRVAKKHLVDPERFDRFRGDLFGIREDMLKLMETYRGRI